MTELFPISEVTQKSPRLIWMEQNDFHTRYRIDLVKHDVPKWEAYVGKYEEAIKSTFFGDDDIDPALSPFLAIGISEAAAIRDLCDNRGVDMI